MRRAITVVGGGVVGSAVACALAKSLLFSKVILIEKRPVPKRPEGLVSNGMVLTNTSVDFLRSLGVWERLDSKSRFSLHGMQIWDHWAPGRVNLSTFEGAVIQSEALRYQLITRLGECQLTEVLHDTEVESISVTEGKREVRVTGKPPISCDLIIGADGVDSLVRKTCEIPILQENLGSWMLQCTVKVANSVNFLMKKQLVTGVVLIAPSSDTEVSVSWTLPPEMAKRRQGLPAAQFLLELNSALNSPPIAYPGYRLPFPLPAFQELVSTREIRALEYREAVEYARPGFALVGLAANSLDSFSGSDVNVHLSTGINLVHSLCQDVELGKHLGAGLEQYSKKSKIMMQVARTWETNAKYLGTDTVLTNMSRGLSMATANTLLPTGLGEYLIGGQINGWQTVPR